MKNALIVGTFVLFAIIIGHNCGETVPKLVKSLYNNPAIQAIIISYYLYWFVSFLTGKKKETH